MSAAVEEFLNTEPPRGDLEKIKRNGWGQPLIGGGKPKGYQRTTTFIKGLDDTSGLEKWKMRQVAIGLMNRRDLQQSVQVHGPGCAEDDADDKKTMDGICQQAMEAAGSSAKATLGSALHRLTERLDRGQVTAVPDWAADDVAAYRAATKQFEWLHIERMLVHDAWQVAGTPDRVALIDGQPTIVDLKTGSFYASTCAMQLAVYANSLLYDITTAERTDIGVRKDKGLIVHLPAGTAKPALIWVDLIAGYEAAALGVQVKAWRKRRDLATPYAAPTPLLTLIAAAPDEAALTALWKATPKDQWTPEATEAAKVRAKEWAG